MALTFGSKITAEDFNNLKAKVKAEMLRRKYTGSVAAYGTDYSDVPTQKGKIKAIHIQEIVNPLNQITATNYTNTAAKSKILAMQQLETLVTTLAAKNVNPANTDTGCNASCTGLCRTACSETCDGCTGSCTGTCQGCSDTCYEQCADNCSTTCRGSCRGGCKNTCTRTCANNCQRSCDQSNCMGSCSGGCRGGCRTSCRGTCDSSTE